ncbi:2-hydroxyacid dehydrogenase [Granulosicoccus antarcticus]|uniref:2-ketogluconate reductase n=1 Tax=Granulosicoccus antarcticus IMCC3135 TaxID=1192854 RepID=A0A2Z2NJN2_9GAMM|nr:2-hydroxyacid dehydrogenase [Granulosicoccus antarcticus]ASJ70281.1 2-ketogluconate reductase [Granulosicoccus antarcticus IMCC3135]
MSYTLLLMGPLLPSVMSTLESSYTVHRYWEAAEQDALLDTIAGDCVGIVTDGGRGVSAAVLEKLPKAKIVSVFGVGVDAVDLAYCREHGISVGNTPDVLSDDVADMAMALALAVSRQLVTGDQYARAGRWPKEGAMPLTRRVMGKRAGIFGMGSIGLALARRLEGFGMQISYCNRSARSDSPHTFVASLEEMAANVDYLFVTAAATPGTIGAVNAAVLDALGPQGYLVNVSRGTLVDEPVLVKYLQENKIAGAGLDVFAEEPSIPEALFSLENVVLQPHNASGTWETREAMGKLVLDNLAAHFNDKPLLTPVS